MFAFFWLGVLANDDATRFPVLCTMYGLTTTTCRTDTRSYPVREETADRRRVPPQAPEISMTPKHGGWGHSNKDRIIHPPLPILPKKSNFSIGQWMYIRSRQKVWFWKADDKTITASTILPSTENAILTNNSVKNTPSKPTSPLPFQ